ncbi:MAG: CBM57, partial [uncultured Adhaeribacter sp.]
MNTIFYFLHLAPFYRSFKYPLIFIAVILLSPAAKGKMSSATVPKMIGVNSGASSSPDLWSQFNLGLLRQTNEEGYLVVENANGFPAADQLAFSLIQVPWRRARPDGSFTAYNENHDRVKLKISNKGTGSLKISDMVLSNPAAWKITQLNSDNFDAARALPLTINPGSSVSITIAFIAKDQGQRVEVLHDNLTITSDDALTPAKQVRLHGLWQFKGEGNNEPYAQEIIDAFGFKTETGYNHDDGAINGENIVPNSDEILSAFFVQADLSKPVKVIQMAAYHGCCADTEQFRYYSKGSAELTTLFTHNRLDGQSLLPRKSGSTTALAQGTFNAAGAFGFKVGRADSDRSKNFEKKIGLRIWKAIDSEGNIIPDAYILGGDYLGTEFTNYDYQDNVFFVSNIKPETGTVHSSELVAAPSAVSFESIMAGTSQSQTIKLTNTGKTYADGTSDPAIKISKIEIAGPHKDEFALPAFVATTLPAQGTVEISVTYNPTSRGIKNANLLVHYNNSSSPLRITLLGTAQDANFTINRVKRIKGGADASVTIQGQTWEPDKDYRKGSIKLDKQIVAGPIAATDMDILYQTYLSAETDLGKTRLEIPIANGNYQVRLHFVENYFDAANARIFNIVLENKQQLTNFDIYREVGYRTALVKDFAVQVADGILNINFNPTVNRVALAGVEIFTERATVTSVDPIIEADK